MPLPELVSEKSPVSASCEKRWYRPPQYALWERSSNHQRNWNRTHHPFETDCTVNVLRVENGQFATWLREGGLRYLLAGTGTSCAVQAGRCRFEVKTVELHSPAEPQNSNCNLQSLVHVGLSFLLIQMLLRISTSLPESVSDKSLESVALTGNAGRRCGFWRCNRET